MRGRLRPTDAARAAREPIDQDTANGLADMIGARVHVDVMIPRTDIPGKMRLLSRAEQGLVRAQAREALKEAGIPTGAAELLAPGVMDEWNCEIAVRTLSIAVRSPSNVELPLDTIEEWRECDDDQIAALYLEYKDLSTRIDPIGSLELSLTDQEYAALDSAAKKGNADSLMSYGCRKLAIYAITSAAVPAS